MRKKEEEEEEEYGGDGGNYKKGVEKGGGKRKEEDSQSWLLGPTPTASQWPSSGRPGDLAGWQRHSALETAGLSYATFGFLPTGAVAWAVHSFAS